MKSTKNSEKAFHWIIEILNRHNVPFIVLGGLAARAYGSTRELNDIDLVIHRNDFEKILPEVEDYLIFGPQMSKDEETEGYSMELEYEGQDIDIGAEEDCRIFNKKTREWDVLKTNFDADMKEVFGITVPLMKKESIIAEKMMFDRTVDREDIEQMQ